MAADPHHVYNFKNPSNIYKKNKKNKKKGNKKRKQTPLPTFIYVERETLEFKFNRCTFKKQQKICKKKKSPKKLGTIGKTVPPRGAESRNPVV